MATFKFAPDQVVTTSENILYDDTVVSPPLGANNVQDALDIIKSEENAVEPITAVQMNGTPSGGYINVPSSLGPYTTAFTVECWMRSTQSFYQTLVSTASSPTAMASWRLQLDGAGTSAYFDYPYTIGEVVGSINVRDGKWHHVAGQYNGTDLSLYIDGIFQASQTIGSHTVIADTIFIGKSWDSNPTLAGPIREIRISDSVRYTTTFVPSHSFVVDAYTIGYWKCNEKTGTTVADSSGNSYTGSFTGSPAPTWYFESNSILTTVTPLIFDDSIVNASSNIRSERLTNQSIIDNTRTGVVNLGSDTNGATQGAVGHYSTIGGGDRNSVSDSYATVPGGYNNTAGGERSFASGTSSIASAYASTAMGDGSTAAGDYSFAVGQSNTASGNAAVATGVGTQATAPQSNASGQGTTASGVKSHAEGESSVASGYAAHAEGASTQATGDYSHAEGNSTTASGAGSHATGLSTFAIGDQSFAGGNNCTASGNYSHAIGYQTVASGAESHAEGSLSQATNGADHAEGFNTLASGGASHAEGSATQATGQFSHSEGLSTVASGQYCHAEGNGSQATGFWSHAEGENTISSGQASHTEGSSTQAIGNYSHAEGEGTTAQALRSHAEGFNSLSSGYISHAEGDTTIASGSRSHAEGANSTASADYSHAQGESSLAFRMTQDTHSSGKFTTAGDAQNSTIILRGSTPGSAVGETVELMFGPAADQSFYFEDTKAYVISYNAVINNVSLFGAFKQMIIVQQEGGTPVLETGAKEQIGSPGATSWTFDVTLVSQRLVLTFTTGITTAACRVACTLNFTEVARV